MLSFISAKEAAEKWNISQRRVSILCSENRINGAMMVGNMWIIPSNAEKPIDKRMLHPQLDCPKIKKFEISIEEMASQTFVLEASSEEDAMFMAIEKYKNGEFILDPGNLVAKQMEIHDIEEDTYTEWFEF